MLRPIAVSMMCATLAGAQGEAELCPTAQARTVGFEYGYSNFQGDIDAWHVAVLSVGERRPGGFLAGRVNMARRFASSGVQFEGDACPKLGKNAYAYVNAGYSPSTIFPAWRSGGEIFRSLPKAMEASLGYRQLRFGGPPVTLFTGTVSGHSGNYWYSLRPFLRDKPTGWSASAGITARRYSADADNYVGGRVSYGSAPNDDIVLSQLNRSSSMSAGLQTSRSTPSKAVMISNVGFEREEVSANRFRNHWQIGAGLKLRY